MSVKGVNGGLSRRRFLAGLAGCAGAAVFGGSLGRAARKPNVIIIYTDDQGAVDAGCYGAKDIPTPNIDALAGRGVRFTQFYAPSAICSPSRAGLLTGRYPVRVGVPGNVGGYPGDPGLPGKEMTVAEVFKRAGYATAHVGKWHLGFTDESIPNAQGFDYSFGHMAGCIDNYSHFFYWSGPNHHDLYRNGKEVHLPGKFFPDLMVDEASKFMENHKNEPFLLYYPMNNPHYPYQGDIKWLEDFQKRGVPYPRDLYGAFVSTLDERIGRLLAKVDELGLTEDTIVVFQADNGYSVEERAHFGGGSAGPYRGSKFSLFEGGIRVPAIISWPGHLPEGEFRGQIGHGCDWLPTLIELCGIQPPEAPLDGRSLVGVIGSDSTPTPHDVLHWKISKSPRGQWAVREGDWKLIGYPQDPTMDKPLKDKLYLTNLAQDISESENLAEKYPLEVKRLEKLHAQWLAEVSP